MLSRLLDMNDGVPRSPVFWLAAVALIAAQLWALYQVCAGQVQRAEAGPPPALAAAAPALPADCLQAAGGCGVGLASDTR